MRKRLEFCKMGNSRILVMMIRNELTYPSRPQAMCTFFIVLHIREKKRKSRLNGNIMIIITNFPCFFCVQQEVGNKDSSGPGACYAMLCCVHFMKKTWVSSPPFTAYLHAKLDQTISALMMKFTKHFSLHPKVVHKCNRSTPPPAFSL